MRGFRLAVISGLLLGGAAAAFFACGGDDTASPPAADGGLPDTTVPPDVATDTTPPPPPPDATPDVVVDAAGAKVERGQYLVEHVLHCGGCHTPDLKDPDGGPPHGKQLDKALTGVECLIDLDPTPGVGCVHSANLTNDPTGLQNFTDDQVKDLFLNGKKPNGERLVDLMPYWAMHNMTPADADAIVAFLRTLKGVDHRIPAQEPPWTGATGTDPIDAAGVPMPDPSYPEQDAAAHGRYLAGLAGSCIECHTPAAQPPPSVSSAPDPTKFFAGSRGYPSALLGFPAPPYPDIVWTANLTQADSGLKGWSLIDVIKVLKSATEPDGGTICGPMPAGGRDPGFDDFGGLSEQDTIDIAHYVLSLPANELQRPNECQP